MNENIGLIMLLIIIGVCIIFYIIKKANIIKRIKDFLLDDLNR